MPGGVNSPVRAFGSVGSTPRFIEQADGVYMTDVDGNKYLDFIGSWGPMILGHNHPAIKEAVIKACEKGLSFGAATEKEVEMAELMTDVIPSLEMVRMVNSGTCLLYTSDAADEEDSVDFGGRRVIKKKKGLLRCCS